MNEICPLDELAGCTFTRPILGEYYSYENGLEGHSSFQETGEIQRHFYRRESGAGATRKDTAGLLVNEDIGECFQLNWKRKYYQLIYRDKYFFHSFILSFNSFLPFEGLNLVFNVIKCLIEQKIFFKYEKVFSFLCSPRLKINSFPFLKVHVVKQHL